MPLNFGHKKAGDEVPSPASSFQSSDTLPLPTFIQVVANVSDEDLESKLRATLHRVNARSKAF
ncbi:hypothetical protein KIJ96_20925 (plasmid) [Pseudoalteromonas piscicida]|uniref:hypothetical protein n=1 Tax=Pseudoalteromonas TaxID=53246 RepID=UPI0015746E12|nr:MULTISPECIES: hypothetical protein [Pseudoalteromonas]UDM64432.1 hypothetical protein KIJ96_20925 [Pseudoalteromonas piscicida]